MDQKMAWLKAVMIRAAIRKVKLAAIVASHWLTMKTPRTVKRRVRRLKRLTAKVNGRDVRATIQA